MIVNKIDTIGIFELSKSFIHLKYLNELNLNNNLIDKYGIYTIENKLHYLKSLKKLYIDRIDKESISSLIQYCNNRNIKLYLNNMDKKNYILTNYTKI